MASVTLTTALTPRFALTVADFPTLFNSSARYTAVKFRSCSPIRGLKYRKASGLRRGDFPICAYSPKDDSVSKSDVKVRSVW